MALDGASITGVEALMRELRRRQDKAHSATLGELYRAGLFVQGESQKRTPVEFGNLRGSAYTQRTSNGAEVGYSAAYAIYVHENMEQKLAGQPRPSGLGTYWNPGGPKFLERAVNENKQTVREMVERAVGRAIE